VTDTKSLSVFSSQFPKFGRGGNLSRGLGPIARSERHGARKLFKLNRGLEKAIRLCDYHISGVSTRKVQAISEELCGQSFSASAISGFNKKLERSSGALPVDHSIVSIPI
jgi:hypothetical protein